MKLPRLSIASIGFIIFIMSINLGLLRELFLGDDEGSPLTLWFTLWITPMIDILLVTLFRLRKPGRRTPGAISFFITGLAATLVIYAFSVTFTDTTMLVLRTHLDSLTMPIMWLAGPGAHSNSVVQWALVISSAVLIPMASLSTPPLLFALLGGSLARRIWKTPHSTDLPAAVQTPGTLAE